jgi:hypothetical protein
VINKCLQDWITEKWTSNFDVKPKAENLMNIGEFMTFAKNYYSKTSKLIQDNASSKTIGFFQKKTTQKC